MQDPLPNNSSLRDGRFTVEALYKRGGQAFVYLGRDAERGLPIIIKQTLGDQRWSHQVLRQEAELLAQLDHPSLPKVLDNFVEQGRSYLVMSYVPGADLSELMRGRGRAFALAEVMVWAEQLLDILEYLQKQDTLVVHRDINPRNLRLTPDNRIFLLDFGIAKKSDGKTLLLGGSLHYAPPEQLKDEGTDHRSDMYSFAATLYYLLTDVEPPDSLSRESACLKGEPDPLIPACRLNTEVPLHVSKLLSQTMSLDRSDRPHDASTFRLKLRTEEVMEDEGEEVTVVSPSYLGNTNVTHIKDREAALRSRSMPMSPPSDGTDRADATAVALSLLDKVREKRPVSQDLLEVVVELLDSKPEVRADIMRSHAPLLTRRAKDDSQTAINLINHLAANSLFDPGVLARLRESLGEVITKNYLASTLSDSGRKSIEDQISHQRISHPTNINHAELHLKWLRALLVWIIRGFLVAIVLDAVFFLLTGKLTLIEVLSLSLEYTIWLVLISFVGINVYLITLIRRTGNSGGNKKARISLRHGFVCFCHGFLLADVLFYFFSAWIK